MKIKRGYLYSADLNPRYGTEPVKMRPVLVLQTDLINDDHPSTIICPITSKVKSDVMVLRSHLRKGESGLPRKSDILIDQIRSIDNRRFKRQLGKLSQLRLGEVEDKIKIILDLSSRLTL